MKGEVHPAKKLFLRVRGVCDGCVAVFAVGAYVETTGMFLPGYISYGPRAMTHILVLYILLRGYIYLPRPVTMSARS